MLRVLVSLVCVFLLVKFYTSIILGNILNRKHHLIAFTYILNIHASDLVAFCIVETLMRSVLRLYLA